MTHILAVTVDLHPWDSPDDIRRAHDLLREQGLRPTYFLPTCMLAEGEFRAVLRTIDDGIAEVGTHGHSHDAGEVAALGGKNGSCLAFLKRSASEYADFFGRRANAFRSPCWCSLAPRTFDDLAALGYLVDSSSTPQRLGLLSSYPFENPWLRSARSPWFVRPKLLEVPTSSFVVPLGPAALGVLRKWGGLMFAAGIAVEALLTRTVVNFQLHASDLVAWGSTSRQAYSWRDLLPVPGRGFAARHWFVDRDRRRTEERVAAVLRLMRGLGLASLTLTEIYERVSPVESAGSTGIQTPLASRGNHTAVRAGR